MDIGLVSRDCDFCLKINNNGIDILKKEFEFEAYSMVVKHMHL